MSKRVRPKAADSFESEVRRRFAPLAKRWGMAGPFEGGLLLPTVKYHAGPLTYTWRLDDEDRAVAVTVVRHEGGRRWSAWVEDLVTGAGLGRPQDVRTSAKTWLALQHSIDSHVRWLERLHPRLAGPDAIRFLTDAGVRPVNPAG